MQDAQTKRYTELLAELLPEMRAEVLRVQSVGGGSINRCVKLETSKGFFFLKENDAKAFPGMFAAEKRGLEWLASTNTFVVPEPLGLLEKNGSAYLLLSWLEKAAPAAKSSYEAGTLLAKLHRHSEKTFGLDHDNYIGSLRQSNRQHNSWEEFFVLERILPQVQLARDAQRIDAQLVKQAEKCCARAADLFPMEKPALLHGDLWSGNFLLTNNGPSVFDPAVYYGHREMDLAMTQLFGGFDDDFYAGYENEFPLENGWRKRIPFGQLYPLLVHVNLFGGGYIYDVKSILSAF